MVGLTHFARRTRGESGRGSGILSLHCRYCLVVIFAGHAALSDRWWVLLARKTGIALCHH